MSEWCFSHSARIRNKILFLYNVYIRNNQGGSTLPRVTTGRCKFTYRAWYHGIISENPNLKQCSMMKVVYNFVSARRAAAALIESLNSPLSVF